MEAFELVSRILGYGVFYTLELVGVGLLLLVLRFIILALAGKVDW